jgi:hypothetical protein
LHGPTDKYYMHAILMIWVVFTLQPPTDKDYAS